MSAPAKAKPSPNVKGSFKGKKGDKESKVVEHTEEKHGGETFDWHMQLLSVYGTLRDPDAPDAARVDALLQCWQIAENRSRRKEEKRQGMVARYGDYPQVPGLILDLMLRSHNEEVQWRAARALMQMCYCNPDVSWLVMHNSMRETRKRIKVAKDEMESVRARIAAEGDGVEQLKERLPIIKKEYQELSARRSGPASLIKMLIPERMSAQNTSYRVQECVIHCLNNMANSCWEGHDLLLRDKVHRAAISILSEASSKPAFVVSACAGLMCSLSYKPETRPMLRDSATIAALGKCVLLSAVDCNSMSAALALANLTGELAAADCPGVTNEMQVPLKVISALQAGIQREQAGSRYFTVWKVMYSCTALASHWRSHLTLAQNGLPASVVELLSQKARNTRTELSCLDVLLRMSFEVLTRKTMLTDVPDLVMVLRRLCTTGLTRAACKAAEATLWALGLTETPFTVVPGGKGDAAMHTGGTNAPEGASSHADVLTIEEDSQEGGHGGARGEPQRLHVYISTEPTYALFAETLGKLITKMTENKPESEQIPVKTTGSEGFGKFEMDGLRGANSVIVLLSDAYQKNPHMRAEMVAAMALDLPIIVACFDPHLELASWVMPALGEEPYILDLSEVYYDPVSKGLRPINKTMLVTKELGECLVDVGVKEEEDTEKPKSRGGPLTAGSAKSQSGIKFDVLEEDDVYANEEGLTLAELLKWNVHEVGEFISTSLGLPQHRDMFVVNSVDGPLLLELDETDLEEDLAVTDAEDREAILGAIKMVVSAAAGD